MHDIKFIHDTHQYFIDGVEFPSVTSILKPLNSFENVPPVVLDRAAQFGQHVHKATELYDQGILNEKTLDSNLVPYLEGWKLFLASMPNDIILNEYRIFSLKYGYAGTLDRVVVFTSNEKTALLDIKTGTESPTFGPQTAAYAKAIEEMIGLKTQQRFTVRLKPNDYRLISHTNKNDFNIFMSCLNVWNFKKKFKA